MKTKKEKESVMYGNAEYWADFYHRFLSPVLIVIALVITLVIKVPFYLVCLIKGHGTTSAERIGESRCNRCGVLR